MPKPALKHSLPCDDILILKEKVAAIEAWRIGTETEADPTPTLPPVPRVPSENRDYPAETGTTSLEPGLSRKSEERFGEGAPYPVPRVPCPVPRARTGTTAGTGTISNEGRGGGLSVITLIMTISRLITHDHPTHQNTAFIPISSRRKRSPSPVPRAGTGTTTLDTISTEQFIVDVDRWRLLSAADLLREPELPYRKRLGISRIIRGVAKRIKP